MATTWNPSDKGAGVTLSGGNLGASVAAASTAGARATVSEASGKWYFEVLITSGTGAGFNMGVGVMNASFAVAGGTFFGGDTTGLSYRGSDGAIKYNAVTFATGATFGSGDTIGVAFDATGRTVSFYKNNVLQSTVTSGSVPSGALFPAVGGEGGGTLAAGTVNFGATATTYTPPSGYSTIDNTFTIFSVTGSGGVQVGGTSPYSPTVGLATGSGGVQVGGTAPTTITLVPTFVSSGGVQVGGAATVQVTHSTIYSISADGQPQGGAIAGGAALVQEVIAHIPSGGALAGGAAVCQDRIPFIASGTAVGGGATSPSAVYAIPGAASGAVGSGAATRSYAASIVAAGGALAGGSATVSAIRVAIYIADLPVGGMVAGGAATVSDRQSFYQASGGGIVGGTALAYSVPAGFTPTAANPYAEPFPGWSVNFDTAAAARILGLPANAFARLGGVTYVSNAAGIFALDGANDAGSPIRARVLLPKDDAGSVSNKRVPAVWISGEMERAMVMQVLTSEDSESYHAVDPPDSALHVTRVEPGKGIEGRFIQLGFGNVQGGDFTLESVEAPLSILKRHGR